MIEWVQLFFSGIGLATPFLIVWLDGRRKKDLKRAEEGFELMRQELVREQDRYNALMDALKL